MEPLATMPNAIDSPRNVCNKTTSWLNASSVFDIKNNGAYKPNDAIDEHMINIRTVDDLNGVKSRNGGFGVRIWVFFSLTCKKIKTKIANIKGYKFKVIFSSHNNYKRTFIYVNRKTGANLVFLLGECVIELFHTHLVPNRKQMLNKMLEMG